jgi:hypothetical protein
MSYKGILIADLHIGAINTQKQYSEIKQRIYPHIIAEKPDFIVFLGDYFDHKFSLNDESTYYAVLIINDIIGICKENNLFHTKLRFVYGTESHEWDQYKFLNAMDIDFDIKVIRYCEEEDLFPDLKVLYIPEEHLYNKSVYYEKFLSEPKKYDYIFGHGIIREVMKEAAINSDSNNSNRKKVPIFSTGELTYACRGQVYYGHYHIHTNINDTVFYVGSFNRWCFGEEEPKGFYLIEKTDNETDNYICEFMENDLADTFKTISFGYENAIFKDQEIMEKKLNQIDGMIKNNIFNHVRFEFNIPKNSFNPEYIMNFVKEKYRFNNDVKVNIVHGYHEEKKKKEKEEIEKWNEENAPYFNKNISIEDKVSYFIGVEFKREIKPDKISIYLNKELSEILKNTEEVDVDEI